MYRYQPIDQRIVDERVAQFRDQTRRYLSGTLSEEAFLPLRLQNGLYVQRHAPMLRVAIPYGMLSAAQLRALARIARRYDRGYGHFSTRQNLQFNWPRIDDVPDILAALAEVQMHAIQTSGNCVRNITTDHLAGVAADEVVDALVWCELLRQWSTLHPEFAYLPRKFKIALSGARADRAATRLHDIGLHALRDPSGATGFRVLVGGGMGRTPLLGQVLREFLPWRHLLSYIEAILRVYNLHGRRDNKYKARLKIILQARGLERFREDVEAEFERLRDGPATVSEDDLRRVAARFTRPRYARLRDLELPRTGPFGRWLTRNVHRHARPGYAAVTISLKRTGVPPGDLDASRMDAVADLADRYSQGELRVTHEQNLVLADVRQDRLEALWHDLDALDLATPNIGLLTNIIACPGGDFCALANARSLPVTAAIQRLFDDLDYLHDIGELDLNVSGCINSCGHHHVGHIGVLGVDKGGKEWYQITIGGHQGPGEEGTPAAVGTVLGPAFPAHEVPWVVERLIEVYLARRAAPGERFVETVRRIGVAPFRQRIYDDAHPARRDREVASA